MSRAMQKKPSGPNYKKQNLLQIREQEEINRQRRMEDAAQQERMQQRRDKLASQYAHAASKVSTKRDGTPSETAGRPTQTKQVAVPPGERIEVFIRETDPGAESRHFIYTESGVEAAKAGSQLPMPDAPVCGTAGGPAGAARRNSGAGQMAPQQQQQQQQQQQAKPSPKPGHIPAYLRQRKQELQEEKDLLQAQLEEEANRKKYPHGHILMGEEEKAQIVAGLEQQKKSLEMDLNRLPMRYDTQSIQNRRKNLEEQIRDVEGKIALFSRKQVFVPTD